MLSEPPNDADAYQSFANEIAVAAGRLKTWVKPASSNQRQHFVESVLVRESRRESIAKAVKRVSEMPFVRAPIAQLHDRIHRRSRARPSTLFLTIAGARLRTGRPT